MSLSHMTGFISNVSGVSNHSTPHVSTSVVSLLTVAYAWCGTTQGVV